LSNSIASAGIPVRFRPGGAGEQADRRAGNAGALDLTLPAADAVGHNPAPRRLESRLIAGPGATGRRPPEALAGEASRHPQDASSIHVIPEEGNFRDMSKIQRIGVGARLSDAVVHGDIIYLAGQVADRPVPDAGKQTQQILRSIDKLLKQCGSDKSKILKCNIWLSDIRYFDEMNKVWDGWVSKSNPPARATVEARLAGPEYLVEIRVVAAK
jgi:enamine deaminase RidA (YjgF/YER057c/UK114 family)